MQLRNYLTKLIPLAGLVIILTGLSGLVAPGAANSAQAALADPSLNTTGFQLSQPEIQAPIRQAWRSAAEQSAAPDETPTSPSATATPTQAAKDNRVEVSEPENLPAIPDRIVIARIDLDAPIVRAPTRKLSLQQRVFEQWLAPDAFAVGWHQGSAFLGKPGNTVLNGHHNVWGKVFGRLFELSSGDEIIVYSGLREFHYVIAQTMIVKERGATLAEREDNAQWIRTSEDERLTLVTCWPATSNTHRLLVIARPIQ